MLVSLGIPVEDLVGAVFADVPGVFSIEVSSISSVEDPLEVEVSLTTGESVGVAKGGSRRRSTTRNARIIRAK